MNRIDQNKHIVLGVITDLERGDYPALLEKCAPDIQFYVIGATRYSGLFRGKQEFFERVLQPLGQQRGSAYREKIIRLVGEGDCVIVESCGEMTTKDGMPYNNEYAQIFEIEHGLVAQWRCYLDTELLSSTRS